MEFEFGQTVQSEAFLDRNPKFMPAFERLITVANQCFGREMKPRNRLEDICFILGHTCREDFLEVVFLAVHGYGGAASKILRGLYERAVAMAYMIKNPDKAERFVRFAAIQEHRALEAALKVVTEKEFYEVMGRTTTAAQIREFYNQVKPEFQTTLCDRCSTTRIQSTWDLDVAAMVHKVGDPYDKYYLGAYTIPTLQIHATLASVFDCQEEGARIKQKQEEAKFALLNATFILIRVIRSQNELFSLNLDRQIEACEKDVVEVWSPHSAQ